MKRFLLSVLLLLIWGCGLSQPGLDTSLRAGKLTYTIRLERNDESVEAINARLLILKNGEILLSDSIFCARLYIEIKDMDSDGNKDLLVFESSGARANTYYNLYLYRPQTRNFKKVDGFSEWPNLNKTRHKGILAACILTGVVYYKFFKLTESGKLIDLDIEVTDDELDGKAFDEGLKKARLKTQNN